MTTYVVWLRRGSGRWIAAVLVGFLLVSLLSQLTWRVELDWATRLTAANILVISPVVAAVAAVDTSSRLRPTLAQLIGAGVRGPWQISIPALAVVTWAVSAFAFTWLVAALLVAADDGVGINDWWILPEVVAPLAAAGAVGLVTGMVARPRVAPVAAAAAVLSALVLAAPWGRGPFEAVTTYGTLTGLQRTPARAAAAVGASLVITVFAVLAALEVNRSRGRRPIVIALCLVACLFATVAPAAWPWKSDVYRFTTESYGCIGRDPAVCGPQSRLKILGPVQTSLAEAYVRLAGTDFVRPAAFRVTRLDHYSDLAGAAPLDFDPADVHGGRYSDEAVARALVRPHQCTGLFEASSAEPLLEAQDVMVPWLLRVLAGQQAASPVPPNVATAFQSIEDCRQMTWDLH